MIKFKKFRPLYIPITLSGQRLNSDIAISQINFQKKNAVKSRNLYTPIKTRTLLDVKINIIYQDNDRIDKIKHKFSFCLYYSIQTFTNIGVRFLHI